MLVIIEYEYQLQETEDHGINVTIDALAPQYDQDGVAVSVDGQSRLNIGKIKPLDKNVVHFVHLLLQETSARGENEMQLRNEIKATREGADVSLDSSLDINTLLHSNENAQLCSHIYGVGFLSCSTSGWDKCVDGWGYALEWVIKEIGDAFGVMSSEGVVRFRWGQSRGRQGKSNEILRALLRKPLFHSSNHFTNNINLHCCTIFCPLFSWVYNP